jgi:4-amino-4-deoxy-L-arabinose transferase-like glycosyltransferase
VAALYFFDLAATPVYLGGDEAHFGVVADAIARTGRNLRGDLLPLFVNLADPFGEKSQPWGDTWYQPFLFYLTALAVKVLPFSEAAVRAPAAFLGGVVSPLLMYFVALRLLRNRLQAMVAALVLALAPVHLILSRQALDYICPLPFVLGWLWCLIAFVQTGRVVFAAAGGLLLGIGCYSYIASWAMMPIYLALSWFVFHRAGRGFARPAAAATIGFALPLVVLIPWLWMNPQMLRETVARYSFSDTAVARSSAADDASIVQLASRTLRTYTSFFDPVTLFVRGGPSMTTSTARTGVFLLPVAIWLPAGLYVLWRRRDPAGIHWVLLAGLLTAPIPAALKGEPYMVQRALYMIPFAALISAMGFMLMWQARHRMVRAAAMLLLLAAPIQFAEFYFDYFTHYKFRSAFYYDSIAFRDVAEYLFDQAPAPAYYFADDLDDVDAKWRFYAIKHARQEVLTRTRYVAVDGPEPAAAAGGTFLVTYVHRPALTVLEQSGQWTIVAVIKDVDQREAAAILRRVR